MKKSLPYKDDLEKNSLIQQEIAAGLTLLEEQAHLDGNFLVFGPPPPKPIEERVADLELRVAVVEKKP